MEADAGANLATSDKPASTSTSLNWQVGRTVLPVMVLTHRSARPPSSRQEKVVAVLVLREVEE
jgi:hypothetical protein